MRVGISVQLIQDEVPDQKEVVLRNYLERVFFHPRIGFGCNQGEKPRIRTYIHEQVCTPT